ncbi:MAG: DUF4406 domain-containing protein [Treponema sp.]|jgi:hypothetical protein|nr:DUF4406 domain-containing protein [Treponema sp.]
MKNIRLYVLGKISGDGDYQIKFMDAVYALWKAGYENIINPCCYVSSDDEWNTSMGKTLAVMLTCGGVALLPAREDSIGGVVRSDD